MSINRTRIFLDTEFTDLDNPKLISVGLAAESGDELYVEISDGWSEINCSLFVIERVLPLLDRSPVVSFSRSQAATKIQLWLTKIASPTIIFDARFDERLLKELLDDIVQKSSNLQFQQLGEWPGLAMANDFIRRHHELLKGNPKHHHALEDARAFRDAVTTTEQYFRSSALHVPVHSAGTL